jgi:hypothetical protein
LRDLQCSRARDTRLDIIKASLTNIDAKLISLNGTVATIETNLGTIEADLADINAKLVSIDGTVATIETDIGIIETDTGGNRIRCRRRERRGGSNRMRIWFARNNISTDCCYRNMAFSSSGQKENAGSNTDCDTDKAEPEKNPSSFYCVQ